MKPFPNNSEFIVVEIIQYSWLSSKEQGSQQVLSKERVHCLEKVHKASYIPQNRFTPAVSKGTVLFLYSVLVYP